MVLSVDSFLQKRYFVIYPDIILTTNIGRITVHWLSLFRTPQIFLTVFRQMELLLFVGDPREERRWNV